MVRLLTRAFMDNQVPAVILDGLVAGSDIRDDSPRTLAAVAVRLAVSIAALVPVYRILIGSGHFAIVWGTPKRPGAAVLFPRL